MRPRAPASTISRVQQQLTFAARAGDWSTAQATGGYRFEIDSAEEGFGHIRDVELLNPGVVILMR